MARKALRQKALQEGRVEYVSSEVSGTDPKTGKPVYHVQMKEVDGKESIHWIERATQRDFSIGLSVAGLAISMFGAPMGATLLLGALIGSASDLWRNSKEFGAEGAKIPPPVRFNRDTVKTSLITGLLTKTIILATGVALAAAIPGFPGHQAVMGVFEGVSGLGGALMAPFKAMSEMLAFVPKPLLLAGYAGGMAVGAKKGAERGYKTMEVEYERAAEKNRNPLQEVTVAKEKAADFSDALAFGAAIPGIAAASEAVQATVSAAMDNGQEVATRIGRGAHQKAGDWASRVGGPANIGSFTQMLANESVNHAHALG